MECSEVAVAEVSLVESRRYQQVAVVSKADESLVERVAFHELPDPSFKRSRFRLPGLFRQH